MKVITIDIDYFKAKKVCFFPLDLIIIAIISPNRLGKYLHKFCKNYFGLRKFNTIGANLVYIATLNSVSVN